MANTTGASALARIARVCRQPVDDRALRAEVLTELRRAVGFDAYAWLLTDPTSEVGTSPVADVPDLAALPRLVRAKYLSRAHRWTTLRSVAVSRVSAAAEGADADEWSRLVASHGVGEVVSAVFRDRYGCWGWLDLWRGADRRPVGTARVDLVSRATGIVTAALRRCVAETFTPPGSGTTASEAGPALLLLSAGLEVLRVTSSTDEHLRLLLPPDDDAPPVPAAAYNVAAQLLAVEAGVDAHPPEARVHVASGRWATMRAARLDGREPTGGAEIAVTAEGSSPTERLDLVARSAGLTVRETEVLAHLARGADTASLARLMTVSPYTVQDHLKSVFAKTSTRSRRDLLARALGSG